MSGPTYADVYDFDNLAAVAGPDVAEDHLMDLHNRLVWHRFHPRENPTDDEIVRRAIERAADMKGAQLREIRDEDILGLIGALFSLFAK